MLPSDVEEKTEVIYGEDKIFEANVQGLSELKESLDGCFDGSGPSVLSLGIIRASYLQLKERGARLRLITEMTKENLADCKEIMKFLELRHLDGAGGNFAIGDRRQIRMHAIVRKGVPPTQMLRSTVRSFVEQQQYVFDELWKKAIPAVERVREIEEGAKREFIETIRDPSEIQKLGYDLIRSAKEEILIIFSTANAFHREARKGGLLQILQEEMIALSLPRGMKIRILVPMDNKIIRNEKMIDKLKRLGINIRDNKKPLLAKLTNLVVDNRFSLTVELKDDGSRRKTRRRKDDEEETIGLATYSNSESTVSSYVSIFETLWIRNK
jgi:two-component system, OmpR family, sensor histidine kinase VicK